MYLFFTLTRPCAGIVEKQWHHSTAAIIGMLLYIAWNKKIPFHQSQLAKNCPLQKEIRATKSKDLVCH
jgi:hypothetical protein